MPGFLPLSGRINYFIHQPIYERRVRTMTRMGREEMIRVIYVKPKAVHRAKDTGNLLLFPSLVRPKPIRRLLPDGLLKPPTKTFGDLSFGRFVGPVGN